MDLYFSTPQIAQAIADRKQAEEVNSRLNCMRDDEAKFRIEMQERRKSALQVSKHYLTSMGNI